MTFRFLFRDRRTITRRFFVVVLFSFLVKVRCLVEIENDMIWRKVPMDRLLCGDVGFGKTEVAIRAMFRSATLFF